MVPASSSSGVAKKGHQGSLACEGFTNQPMRDLSWHRALMKTDLSTLAEKGDKKEHWFACSRQKTATRHHLLAVFCATTIKCCWQSPSGLDDEDDEEDGKMVDASSFSHEEGVNTSNQQDKLTYYKEPKAAREAEEEAAELTRRDKARQRWKILCLVKTSDTVADEAARQDRLKEKVDEWMSSMAAKMKISDEPDLPPVNGECGGSLSSGRSSPLVHSYKEHLEEIRKKTELEQMKRIRERELREKERERLLVLEGKVEMTSEHLKDPVLKRHRDFMRVGTKAKKQTERKISRLRKTSKPVSAIQVRWKSAMDRLKLLEDESNTVVANLVYDEEKDRLSSPLLDGGEPLPQGHHPNPVFQAFDGARGVDDLYRIAEIWVNPATYYFS